MKKLYLLLTLIILSSCEKELLEPDIIDEPDVTIDAPPVYYNTAIENHEWNDGWFNHNTHNENINLMQISYEDLHILIMVEMVIWMFLFVDHLF